MSTGSGRRAEFTTILLAGVSFILVFMCFRLLPEVFEPWNSRIVDRLFVLRASVDSLHPAYNKVVVHVDINNTAIRDLNDFYLNRGHFAQVVRNLSAMRTAAQAYDFIFAAKSNEKDDSALIESTREASNVYFGTAFELSGEVQAGRYEQAEATPSEYLDSTKWAVKVDGNSPDFYRGTHPLPTFPLLAHACRGLGFLSIKADRDGVIRRVPLLVKYGDGVYPSLPFRVVCDYLKVPPEAISVIPGSAIVLKDVQNKDGSKRDIRIPVDRYGNMIISFLGPWERMTHYSFADIYRASDYRDELEMWGEELEGKIVLICDVSTGATDIGPVPTDANFPLSGLHANVIHTILTEDFFREASAPEMLLIDVALFLAVVLLSRNRSSVGFSLGMAGLVTTYAAVAGFLFFHSHVILQLLGPFFSCGLAVSLVTAYRYFNEEKEKETLRRSFEAYFPPSVVRKIIASPELISSRGQKKELTVLFSDIKSFTAYTAELSPDQIRKLLNEYFDSMVEIVFRHGGTVDKYIGDGLMVFFGDPEPQEDHAERCVRTAMEMQQKTRQLREVWEKGEGFPLRIRIGISTGEMVVGNMGSRKRLSYTVLGTAVNLAQRLESKAPEGGVFISERTHDLVKDRIPTRYVGELELKGIERPVRVHEVILPT